MCIWYRCTSRVFGTGFSVRKESTQSLARNRALRNIAVPPLYRTEWPVRDRPLTRIASRALVQWYSLFYMFSYTFFLPSLFSLIFIKKSLYHCTRTKSEQHWPIAKLWLTVLCGTGFGTGAVQLVQPMSRDRLLEILASFSITFGVMQTRSVPRYQKLFNCPRADLPNRDELQKIGARFPSFLKFVIAVCR